MRPSQRANDQLRDISFSRHYLCHAEGSVLACYGNTKVICTASVTEGVPPFLRESNQGWLTAEYGMLPRSTNERMNREASRGKQGGRTLEIQRLIGRALRAAIDLKSLWPYTITMDCDVIQADGGTRTAAISGAWVALSDAIDWIIKNRKIRQPLLKHQVAAVSVGIYEGKPVLDLDYEEDFRADTDMNIVMTDKGSFIEIQGTAEEQAFHESELHELLSLAKKGIQEIFEKQKQALKK